MNVAAQRDPLGTTQNPLAPFDEQALVERAVGGDREAFSVLYRHYVTRIYAFAYRRCGSRDLAEDVTAASFERALRHLTGFEWKGGGFGPWLFRLAARELVDHYRADERARGRRNARALRASLLLSPAPDIDPAEAGPEPNDALRAGLDALSPRHQQAISLRYLAGLSPEESAAAMGTSKATMAVTLHRALRALRTAMEQQSVRTEEPCPAAESLLPVLASRRLTLGKEGA